MVLWPASALATQSLTLDWDPSTSTDTSILGYNIYYGTASHIYTSTVSVENVTQATITGLVEGTTYYFAVTAYDDSYQESDFSNEKTYDVPISAVLPITSTLAAGQNVTFDVTATGTGPVNYQWKYHSTNIGYATNAVLTLNNVTEAQAGTYYVNVSNATGLNNTIAVNLTVQATMAATLTQAGYSGSQYSLKVSGVTGSSYVVQASTNLADWISIGTNIAPFTFVDSQASQFKQRYYRTFYQDDSTSSSSTVSSTVNATATATLSQAGYANDQYSFKVSGGPNYSCVVQASTNLVDWISIGTNVVPFMFVDSQASQFKQRFYRTICQGDFHSTITVSSTVYSTETGDSADPTKN